MLFGHPRYLGGGEPLAVASILAIHALSPVLATSQEQQILGDVPIHQPETTASKCIPQYLVHKVMLDFQEMNYSEHQLDTLHDDPDYVDITQLCYTRHPELSFTARTTYHDRIFDIIIHNGPARGFDNKRLDNALPSFVKSEVEEDEPRLAKLQDGEGSSDEDEEEMEPFRNTIEIILGRIEGCHDLIHELSASDSADSAERTPTNAPLQLRSLAQMHNSFCIWPDAPDYDARIALFREEQCNQCIDRSLRFDFCDPPEPIEKMEEVRVSLQVQTRTSDIEGWGHYRALSYANFRHRNEDFTLDLNPFMWLYGYEMAEALVFDWVQRVEHACTWDVDELPKEKFIHDSNGNLDTHRTPCKQPEVVEDVRLEIQTLCEPVVRDLLANLPNHGLVVNNGVTRELRIALQDGKPTCIPYAYERTTKPETESCRYRDDTTRFSNMLETIQKDEQARIALEDVPIVLSNIVELEQKWSNKARVNGTSFQFRHVPYGGYGDSVSDVTSMLRILQWAKSHPDDAAHLHVQALQAIVVDPWGCYQGVLIEPRDVPSLNIISTCLHQCSKSKQEKWLKNLRQDMQLLLQGPELDETIVDSANVAIDKDGQTWLVDFKGPLDTGSSINWYDAKQIVQVLSKEVVGEHDEEDRIDESSPAAKRLGLKEFMKARFDHYKSHQTSGNMPDDSEEPVMSSAPVEFSPGLSIPEDDDTLLSSLLHAFSAFEFSTVIDLNIRFNGITVQAFILGPGADKQVEEFDVSGLTTLSEEQYQKLFDSKTDDSNLIKQLWSKHVAGFVMEQCGDFLRQISGNKSLFGLGKKGTADHVRFGIARDEIKGHLRCIRADKSISPV